MQSFHYRARDQKGLLVKGQVEAENPIEAKRILAGRQLAVLSVGSSPLDKLQDWGQKILDRVAGQVSLEELIVFNRQLQTSNSVGLSLLKSLALIADQSQSEKFRKVIEEVIQEVAQGHALHQALSRYPHIFDSIYVNAIKAGEASGRLDDVLSMLSYFAELRMETAAKVKNATLYPKLVVGGMVVVMLVVVNFVIPKFQEFYSRFGGELPALTLFVVGFSNFVSHFWYLLLLLGGGAYWAFQQWLKTAKGRRLWDGFLLKLPVFGPILLQSEVLTFAIVLKLLLKSGVPIVDSLDILGNSLSNQVLKDEITSFRDSIQAGSSIGLGFQNSKVFPKMVGNLISVGEEGGKVEEVLDKVASYYKVQLEYRLGNLSKAIEPLFLIVIFGFVLVLVLAIYLPIWKMSQLMRPH